MPPSPTAEVSELPFWRIALPGLGAPLLFGMGAGAILPMVALTALERGATVSTAALLVALISIGTLVCTIPASWIITCWGERRAFILAGVWSSLGMLICFGTQSLLLLAAGCVMIGMSQAVSNLARQSFMTDAVPSAYRARALSTLGGVVRIGMFLGPLVAAVVVHHFEIRAAYLVGACAVLAAAVVGARLPDLQRTAGHDIAHPLSKVTIASTLRDHRRVFLTLGMCVVLVGAVRGSWQVVIPLWAQSLALAPAAVSVIYALSGGIDMLVFYPAGKLMDAKGRRWVAIPSMLIMGTALLLVPFTTGFLTLLVTAMLVGFGNGISSGMIMTLGADHSPKSGRPQFLAIWRFLADLGGSTGPSLISLLAASLSLAAGIAASGLIALCAAAGLARFVPKRARPG